MKFNCEKCDNIFFFIDLLKSCKFFSGRKNLKGKNNNNEL